jgi:spore coat protein CotH
LKFIHILNKTPEDRFEGEIASAFDVESFLSFLAVNTAISNFDAYPAVARNYYLYENPKTGKIEFIPWDMNAAFGIAERFFGLDPGTMYANHVLNPHLSSKKRPLVSRILSVESFRKSYLSKLESMLAGPFTEKAMSAEIDFLAKAIRPAVVEDELKCFSTEIFERILERDVTLKIDKIPGFSEYTAPGLKSFVKRRWSVLRAQLDEARESKGD